MEVVVIRALTFVLYVVLCFFFFAQFGNSHLRYHFGVNASPNFPSQRVVLNPFLFTEKLQW